jgi:hypothetical protein
MSASCRRSVAPGLAVRGLGAVTLAAFLLAGCGESGSPLSRVEKAAAKTLTQTVSAATTLSGAEAVGGSAVQGGSEFAFPRQLGYEGVSLPGHGAAPALTVYLDFFPAVVDVESPPGLTLPAGKTWVSTSLAVTPPVEFPRLVAQLEGLNPALLLEEIVWGTTSARSLGQQVVGHIPYAAYAVVVDLRRALAGARRAGDRAMSAAIQDELSALGPALGAHGRDAVAMTLWVDGPGRVAQLSAVVPGSGLGTITTTLSQFGLSVPRNPPATAETVDLATVAASARSRWLLGG